MRESEQPASTPAASSLLIAHPGLLDPNFNKTVLLISSWDPAQGAFGLVLNRAAGRTVAELLPGRTDLGALGTLPVFLGGPVSRDQLIFAAFQWHGADGTIECRHHVSLGEAEELSRSQSGVVRPYIGYSGWAKGQLEAELAQHAWLQKPADRSILELEPGEPAWRNLIASFGPKYRLIAEAPDNPSRN